MNFSERNFLFTRHCPKAEFVSGAKIEDFGPVQLQFPDYRQFTLEANFAKGQSDWIAYLLIYQAVYSD